MDLLSEPLHYAFFALAGVSMTVGLVQLCGHSSFRRLRDLPVIQKRFPRIVQTEARMVMVLLIVVLPATYFNDVWLSAHSDHGHTDEYSRYQEGLHNVLSAAITPAIMYFVSHIEAMRLWLMYYELMTLQAMQHEEWGKRITSNFWRQSFYLRHRANRGNAAWLSKRVFVYWLSISTISGMGNYYVLNNEVHHGVEMSSHFLRAILLLFPLILIAYLWKRLPTKQGDEMMIEEEFNVTCYVVALSFIAFVTGLILMAFGFEFAMNTVKGAAMILTASSPSVIATVWIPRRISIRTQRRQFRRKQIQDLILEKGLFKDRNLQSDGTRTGTLAGELVILFDDAAKMKALGSWMTRSLTMEHFLCFVEMVQFKENVIAIVQQQNEQFDQETVVGHRHRLYGHCPKSSIVFNGPDGLSLKELGVAESVVLVEMAGVEEKDEDVVVVVEKEREQNLTPDPVAVTLCNEASGMVTGEQPMDDVLSVDAMNMANILNNNNPDGQDTELVLDEEAVRSLKRSAHLLFKKYFEYRTALQLNIKEKQAQPYYVLEQLDYAPLRPIEWVRLYDDILAVLEPYIANSYHGMISRLHELEKEGLAGQW